MVDYVNHYQLYHYRCENPPFLFLKLAGSDIS